MAYGGNNKAQQPQVTVQQSVGGTPNATGQFPASVTDKQRTKAQQKGQRGQQQGQGQQGNGNGQQKHPLSDYLNSDPDYVNTTAQLRQALADYRLGVRGTGGALDQIGQQFHSQARDLRQEKSRDLPMLESDYASRGLENSGLYAGAHSDYKTQYQNSLQDLVSGRQNDVQNILNSLLQFRHQIHGQMDSARLEAVRRRAAQLGLNV